MEARELNIMLTMLFWKKAWIWIKHYWYWPVIIVLLLFSMFSGSNVKNKLFELLFKQRENYEKELQIIKETSEETDKKKTGIFKEHKEELEKIEKEHDVRIEELEKEKREELATTIEENKDKPEKLAEEIAKILNAQFHKKNR